MPYKTPVPEAYLNELRDDLRHWISLDLTPEQATALVDSDPALRKELIRTRGCDTVVREMAYETLAQQLLKRSWPMICEGDEAFFPQLKEAAINAGYTFL